MNAADHQNFTSKSRAAGEILRLLIDARDFAKRGPSFNSSIHSSMTPFFSFDDRLDVPVAAVSRSSL